MCNFLNVVFLFQSFGGFHRTIKSKTFNVPETFIACYYKGTKFLSNILIPISFKPDGTFDFSILKVYDIRLQRYSNWKFRVCGINASPLNLIWKTISLGFHNHHLSLIVLKWFDCSRIIVTLLKLKLSPHNLTFNEQYFH